MKRAWRVAATVLALGGLAVLWGSFETWETCSSNPCGGGLTVLYPRSGVDLGPGVLTALFGLVLTLVGLAGFRGDRSSLFKWVPLVLASAVLATLGVSVVGIDFYPESKSYGPGLGVAFVAAGGAVALIAGARMRWLVRP